MPMESGRLFKLILWMMDSAPGLRPTIEQVSQTPAVRRARDWMYTRRAELIVKGATGAELFAVSPLASEPRGVLEMLLEEPMGL